LCDCSGKPGSAIQAGGVKNGEGREEEEWGIGEDKNGFYMKCM